MFTKDLQYKIRYVIGSIGIAICCLNLTGLDKVIWREIMKFIIDNEEVIDTVVCVSIMVQIIVFMIVTVIFNIKEKHNSIKHNN